MEMIELDGEAGGGQLLRTALSLSLCTGIGFTMERIRARRSRPGLMRQHLTAVRAAAEIGQADVTGAELGSMRLRFVPGPVTAGDYRFSTSSAGSTTLVLQTVWPALWQADAPSRLWIEGGTHNPMAPCADFIADTYLPALQAMGVGASVELLKHGFYPAGGGSLHASVQPASALRRLALHARGDTSSIEAFAMLSALDSQIGHRELRVLGKELGLDADALHLRSIKPPVGPGNALLVKIGHAGHVATFTAYGQRGVQAEQVALKLAHEVKAYLASTAYACEHLADQLVLPMALAGGGEFTTHRLSDHLQSNARLIEKFLPVDIRWQQQSEHVWRVVVES
ncbi:MAG TPA: RNA 3'-terminal phosphate cyclase [Dyella sp.]|uniref:RNA 3'-terminal phosphate cyclase n=1 Tax=Dyella sp. TaxID=1869338 RepID=UPI002F925318